MHILITGGTGLIGHHFIQHYPQYRYTVLTRNRKQTDQHNIEYIYSLEQLRFLPNIDVILNLQGESLFAKRWSTDQKFIIEQSRYDVTQQISSLINTQVISPSVFISGSAIGFYGRQTVREIDEEFDQPFYEFSHQLCKTWENIALLSKDNTRVCLLRTGIVLSDKDGALAQMLPSFKWGAGAVMANGKQYMSWIHIKDIVELIDFIIKNSSITGAINATAPTPVSNSVFSHALAKQLHRPCWFTLPTPFLKLVLGQVSELLTFGQHVIPKKAIDSGFTFNYPELDTALSDILSSNAAQK